MNNDIFTLKYVDNEKAIIEVHADNAFTVATHPYISSVYKYITFTMNGDYNLTIVRTDGTTFSYSAGTIVTDRMETLWKEVVKFLEKNGIMFTREVFKMDFTKMSSEQKFKIYKMWTNYFSDSGYDEGYETIEELAEYAIEPLAKEFGKNPLELFVENMSENFSNSDDVFWIDDVWNIIKSGSYEEFLNDHEGYFDVSPESLEYYFSQDKDFKKEVIEYLEGELA